MPAKDIYHDAVRNALLKDNWNITKDPFILRWGARDLYIDLGAEKLIAAQKKGQKIAVEIKSFVGSSPVADLENALGQYIFILRYPQSLRTRSLLVLSNSSRNILRIIY
ncbi:MAG: element excision factor XisH family protein [Aulosira sp. ZfuVER01]|nr:element excision factor XisH family protein [Aulosira sp. ZfuVER01]MDZ8000284.1 element excision factor XisH family protein [Aulosira sp. DedVER01a]MDZ8054247.1 element excision factor XisH family protein [Aulosira sp. ZfuCHP01]